LKQNKAIFIKMNTANFNKKIIESWWNILSRLSKEARIELASRLINSLNNTEPEKKKDSWEDLFGSWEDDSMSAEEMVNFVRESRVSYRKIEPLD